MKKFDQINVIPFIDIMLVLLAITLTSATFIAQGKIKVNLPTSQTAQASSNATQTLQRITVTDKGDYFLNDQSTTLDIIAKNAKSWAQEQAILLKIDSASEFNEFVKIGDILRLNELHNVTIQTQISTAVSN